MRGSLFNSYENRQQEPICLKWLQLPQPVPISHDEFIFAGELITIDQQNETQRSSFYVLTKKSLIESSDTAFKSPINALQILHLRHPRVKEIMRTDIGL